MISIAAGIDPKYADPPQKLVLLPRRSGRSRRLQRRGLLRPGSAAVKERFGHDFLVVCPGIRPEWAAVPGDDQKRITTPFKAVREGRITWWWAGPSVRPKIRWRPPEWSWRKLPRPWPWPDRQLPSFFTCSKAPGQKKLIPKPCLRIL